MILDITFIMESVPGTVMKEKTIGRDQCIQFVDELLSTFVTPVTAPLSKNKRPLFSLSARQGPSKGSLHQLSMMSDCNLFSGLYMACEQDMVM